MHDLIALYDRTVARLARADGLLATLARLLFAGVLLFYFWNSALTKLGDGILGLVRPSFDAYAQIFPRAMEAAEYDIGQLSILHTLVVLAGTWAEFLLPLLIVLGLFTRLAALGMTGFVAVQTLTDLYGHRVIDEPKTLGGWFDGVPDALIADQRALWVFLLLLLVVKGAGPISLDHLLRHGAARRNAPVARPAAPR